MNVVTQKYRMKAEEAKLFVDFLLPMLNCFPEHRISACDALDSQWVNHQSVNHKMDEEEFREFQNSLKLNDPDKEEFRQ